MPRAIWTGSISFGLVNVPVRMHSAIDEQDLDFDLIHEKDGGHIGYQKYCKLEDDVVPTDEIVKGYEVEKGEYVYLSADDFQAAEAENHKTIDIRDFVPYEEIDPIYFERTYYLGPQEGAERVYALLVRAMEESGLAAIATYVLRDRQHLGCLRIRDGVILLEKMFFADEIRPGDEIAPGDVEVDERELEMAAQLIDRFAGTFEPEQYEDTYRARLLEIVEAKRKGEEVHVERTKEPEEPGDLLAALRASLEATKGGRAAGRSARGKRASAKSERKPKRRAAGKR
ncbi:MAG: Ku protein [Thermoleophilia bacterium]|nr:Ku protein [Thermoleophilia bacterium]